MTDKQNPRKNGLSLEQRAWKVVKRSSSGMKPREVAKILDVHPYAASQALRRLYNKGAMTRKGWTLSLVYTAVGVMPDDMRGTSLGSSKALLVNDRRKSAPIRMPKARHALDKAWPISTDQK